MSTGKLYVVATPIGNLSDLSPRAAAVLGSCDFVAAEDTRVTLKLLNHLELKKPMVSCYKQNEKQRMGEIVGRILRGESCALCSDAGTPAVSDPGEELVREAKKSGIEVIPIPGCCAAIAALCASGMPSRRFCFEGFLPPQKKERRARLAELASESRTMIFYEAPHHLKDTLRELLSALGDRELSISREITKLHEETFSTTLSAAIDLYSENDPRGEFVLVVSGAEEVAKELSAEDSLSLVARLREQGLSLSDACKKAAAESSLSKSELYRLALEAEA